MSSDDAVERIAELDRRMAGLLEMVDNMPPTLPQALDLHAKWLRKEKGGVQLDLSGVDLSGANLRRAILTGTDLRHTNLKEAKLDATVARALAPQAIKSQREERGNQSPRGRG